MPETMLRTKHFRPPLRPNLVIRPRLIEQLNQGLDLGHKLTLISAPAGFGKTTLASEWAAACRRPVAWLSLDEEDNDPTRFLIYFVAALQTIAPDIGKAIMTGLQSPQPPPPESILTALLNELSSAAGSFILVLDDYHLIDNQAADNTLTFLIQHQPPQMHLAIATREDPNLPLARLRARGQLSELRAADLRFSSAEAAGFLNQVMGLDLSEEEIAALETRTEGWIAGLQLAALSMRGHKDAAGFIRSFTGSHRFVLDYLVEEVLQQQPANVQEFLLRTSLLDRLCGPLCDAVLRDPTGSGQETLEFLEQANLFLVPLDNERRWYRYHHLFGDFLRQRLQQSSAADDTAGLYTRASGWFEENGLDIEAFHYAATAQDIDRAARLVEGNGMPLLFRGAVDPVLQWLESLPTAALDARPSLWVIYGSALLFVGQLSGVEEKAAAAEAALKGKALDDKNRDTIGHIAAIRATLALSRHDGEAILVQSRRALEYLHPDNLAVRTATTWTLGYAYQLQGERIAAGEAYREAIAISQAIGHIIVTLAATNGLGSIQEAENQLPQAVESYQRVLQLAGDPPPPITGEAYLGLARIQYEWNDLDAAQVLGQQGVQLAKQMENSDRFVAGELLLARLKLARGDAAGAAELLARAEQAARQHHFNHQLPEIASAQLVTLLRQGKLEAAADLAGRNDLPISRARLRLAQGDSAAAVAILAPLRQQMAAKGWQNERLKVMALEAAARYTQGETETAVRMIDEALARAEPGGFIRLFIDEGPAMAQLLSAAAAQGIMPDYTARLLGVFEHEKQKDENRAYLPGAQPLLEPLTPRERDVLQLLAAGRSNPEIAEELVIAVTTVKTHVKNIYGKLGVNNRFQAIARSKALDLS